MPTLVSSPNYVSVGTTGAPIHEVIDSLTNQRKFGDAAGIRTVTDSITAFAGGGKASATVLVSDINFVTTVATAADSVLLPGSKAGMVVYVVNNAAANAMQVFGAGTDTINGVATGTGVSQAAGKGAIYVCATAGVWIRILSA